MRLKTPVKLANGDKLDKDLNKSLVDTLSDQASQVNRLTEGFIEAVTNAATTVPTAGTYAPGDVVRNSTPSELGTATSKYVIYGWMCMTSDPLTFVQMRFLTGN